MSWKVFWISACTGEVKKVKKVKNHFTYLRKFYTTFTSIFFTFFTFFTFWRCAVFFYHKCPLSHNYDKSCSFATERENVTYCNYIIGYYHDTNIANLKSCFVKMNGRDRLAWRNRMIKKFGPAKI